MFAPGPDPEMLAEVSAKLRTAAGLPAKPTGTVVNGNGNGNGNGDGHGLVEKVKDAVSYARVEVAPRRGATSPSTGFDPRGRH